MQTRPHRPARLALASRRIVLVGAATLLLAGTGGAVALALSGQKVASSTERGNAQPIDDNHPAPPAAPTPGRSATTVPAPAGRGPAPVAPTTEAGDDHSSTTESGDDHGGHGTDG